MTLGRGQHVLLVTLLRLGGVVTVMAFAAVFLPVEWMAATHEWLGLGEFPRSAIVDYLTRSIALLYGFHGVLLFLVSTDPVRYRPIAQFIGIMNILMGMLMVLIDLYAGMPALWTLAEGPPIAVFGAIILFLVRGVPQQTQVGAR